MVYPTCFGITLPLSGSVPSAFWAVLNWGAVDRILWMGVLCLGAWCVSVVFHAYINEMHGSRRKIPSKNLVRQRCSEGFNSGVKGLKYVYIKILFCHRWVIQQILCYVIICCAIIVFLWLYIQSTINIEISLWIYGYYIVDIYWIYPMMNLPRCSC
jgi:hypothetical protein